MSETETNKFRPKKIELRPMAEMPASLRDVEVLIIDTVHYGSYLEEQIVNAERTALLAEKEYNLMLESAENSEEVKKGKDAKLRALMAKNLAEPFHNKLEAAKSVVSQIKGYAKVNNSKNEALRSIFSARKTVFEKTYNNS